jgi:hypothetical protein
MASRSRAYIDGHTNLPSDKRFEDVSCEVACVELSSSRRLGHNTPRDRWPANLRSCEIAISSH